MVPGVRFARSRWLAVLSALSASSGIAVLLVLTARAGAPRSARVDWSRSTTCVYLTVSFPVVGRRSNGDRSLG